MHAPKVELDAVVEPARARLLPSGALSVVQERIGTVSGTFEAVRLRQSVGLADPDRQLATALLEIRGEILTKTDPLTRGMWLVSLDSALGTRSPDADAVIPALRASFPEQVSLDTVETWARYVDVLALLQDEPPPSVPVTLPPPGTRPTSYAWSLYLARAQPRGSSASRPSLLSDERLVETASTALSERTVQEAEAALEAAASLGWTPDAATAVRIDRLLRARKNCPGFPSFYRNASTDHECGTPATSAGFRMRNLIEPGLDSAHGGGAVQ
jgi:hypothetical protein